jgi:hypothetical protein
LVADKHSSNVTTLSKFASTESNSGVNVTKTMIALESLAAATWWHCERSKMQAANRDTSCSGFKNEVFIAAESIQNPLLRFTIQKVRSNTLLPQRRQPVALGSG